MACNSVPIFFGAKARTKKPPGLDITTITDLSGSMQPYASYIASLSTLQALELALVSQDIGITSQNRYSFVSGGGRSPAYSTLSEISKTVTTVFPGSTQSYWISAPNEQYFEDYLEQLRLEKPTFAIGGYYNAAQGRGYITETSPGGTIASTWASGSSILSGSTQPPTLTADKGSDTEDMGLASNLISNNDREYLAGNERIIIAGSDEQSYSTVFAASPTYGHRYVGIHQVALSIAEPAGPNPVPSGTLVGFVYTTSTLGTAIYLDGTTINYRTQVPVADVTATGQNGTLQVNVDQAAATNGAIYNIAAFTQDFTPLGESLGTVLGQYLYEIS